MESSSGICSRRASTSRRRSSRRGSRRRRTARPRWRGQWAQLPSSSVAELWQVIAEEASAESPLWADALLREDERKPVPVFSPLGEERFALGLETIYEGYLLHYGRPRLFAPADRHTSLLLGDYLYAH